MTDLISRTALLDVLRKERNDFFARFATQEGQPMRKFMVDFGDELEQLDRRIAIVEQFPAVEPIAKVINDNQPGWTNIIETAPNITLGIGTELYMPEVVYRAKELDSAVLRENAQP